VSCARALLSECVEDTVYLASAVTQIEKDCKDGRGVFADAPCKRDEQVGACNRSLSRTYYFPPEHTAASAKTRCDKFHGRFVKD
jgi:hypothetical protein